MSSTRFTLWRGIVGSAPVVATALTLELGRTLVVDSFGDAEVVEALADALRVVSVLLVGGGLVCAGYRWFARRRDEEQRARTVRLLAGSEAVPVEVLPGEGHLAQGLPAANDPAVALESDVVRSLPPSEFDSAALLAVLAAVTEVRRRYPPAGGTDDAAGTRPVPPSEHTAHHVLGRLLRARVIRSSGAHRYRLCGDRILPPSREDDRRPAWSAAVCALVRHYADRAGVYAIALGQVDHAGAARRWFEAVESTVVDLIGAWAEPGSREEMPSAGLPDVVRLVDALEVWYSGLAPDAARHQRLRRWCRDLAESTEMRRRLPFERGLLLVRGGDPGRHRRFRPMRWSSAVEARRNHAAALGAFATAASPGERARVVADLERTWWKLPRTDVTGEVCVLINLAVVELTRDCPDAAADRLELVFARTESGRDPDGRTLAHEIRGIVDWSRGAPTAAVVSWRAARTGYLALADTRGAGRCLRNLGSALCVAPDLSEVALGRERAALTDDGIWQRVAVWLARADTWSPLEPGSPLAEPNYREQIEQRRDRTSPTIEEWPLDLVDPHLRIPA